jgi:hypothetical protein
VTVLFGFDPGAVTGVVKGEYGRTEPWKIVEVWAVPGGAKGFEAWWRKHGPRTGNKVVREKFTLNSGNPFTADLTPKEVEAVMDSLWDGELYEQARSDKHDFYDALLAAHGLWYTGSQVDWTDGRDVNDAIIHSLEWMRRMRHLPTIREYFKED